MTEEKRKKAELSEVLGQAATKEEAEEQLRAYLDTYVKYCRFSEKEKKEVLAFIMGNRGLKITYDVFFKKIMNPEEHPERLSAFISQVIGEEVQVVEVLPVEGVRLSESDSLVIMDIVVRLLDGTLADVEMQKIGYAFPGQRMECYLSDLTMRQYNRLKAKSGNRFRFADLQKIYMIIIMEKSSKEFLAVPDSYLHHRQVTFDTGVQLQSLYGVTYVCLDMFKSIVHNINTELEAWLTFLSSDQLEDIIDVITAFPEFRQLYRDMARFRKSTKEVVAMYTDAFKEAELGTMEYMVDEMQKEIDEKKEKLQEKKEELQEKQEELQEKKEELQEKQEELQEKKQELEKKTGELEEKKEELQEKQEELQEKQEELQEKQEELQEKTGELEERKQELEKKTEELDRKKDELSEKTGELGRVQEQLAKIEAENARLREQLAAKQ